MNASLIPSNENSNFFSLLPLEIAFLNFDKLLPRDLYTLRMVCRNLKMLVNAYCEYRSKIFADFYDEEAKSLVLSKDNFRSFPILELCFFLQHHTDLKILKLENIYLGDDRIVSICDALRNNTALKELELINAGITDQSALQIVRLASHASICKLNLYNNSLGDNGILSIVNALYGKATTVYLDVRDNKFTSKGHHALAAYPNMAHCPAPNLGFYQTIVAPEHPCVIANMGRKVKANTDVPSLLDQTIFKVAKDSALKNQARTNPNINAALMNKIENNISNPATKRIRK